jgi:acetyl esterase/lipase
MRDQSNTIVAALAAGLLGAATLLPGCSAVDMANSLTPKGNLAITRDIAYGDQPRQQLDVYRPKKNSKSPGDPHPIVVFIYGGSWQSGDKADYLFAAQAFTERGYAVVVPDYRLYPQVVYPAFLQDTAAAVAWAIQNAATFHGDADRVFLVGHSAGAYNAVMLALDTPHLADRGIDRSKLAGVVGLAGPYDFLPTESRALQAIFTERENPEETQPINRVAGDEPPMLLLHGKADETVRPQNATALADVLRRDEVATKVIFYEDYDHVDIVSALASVLRDRRPVIDDIATWMDRRE